VATLNRRVVVQVACPAAEREAVLALFRECQFRRLEPDEDTVRLPEYVARRREKARRLQEQAGEAGESLRQLAAGGLRQVEMALGYWEERLNIAATAGLLAESKRLTILKCYVRAEDLAAFQDRVASGLPGVALRVADPRPGETTPVSLRNPRFLAPAQFLVSMFGLPDYFALDPTPVIFFSFLVFFGFCFGDVIYGVGLIALGLVLARKYREYTNLRHFFVLLTWAGIPTIVVGALTGSWAGDLPKYLGEGNPVQRLSDALKIADPVVNAVQVLALALVIGMVNQWVGIVMGMVRNLRQGDVKAAIYDGVFWLLLLPGFALVITGIFVPLPAVVRYAALAGMAVGAVGLALTQGRGEKTLLGKALIGLVSLYGVVGTYGVTAFVGDTLSYCRLLALGLTTGIVAVCFNMIADLSRKLPVVGIVLCLVVLIAGHLLNFFLSILGGFVHSARLTFVEFFGRFYQGGAPRFAPLGCWRGRIRVTDSDRVWTD
jgi:V/A-type H+-transporting ATPase subunit I